MDAPLPTLSSERHIAPKRKRRIAGPSPTIQREIDALNERRTWWILVVTTVLTGVILVVSFSSEAGANLLAVQILDLVGSAIFFILLLLARFRRLPRDIRKYLAPAYAVFFVLLTDGYFFSAYREFGDNAAYVVGILTPSALLLLRPLFFLPFLMLNHLVFCFLLGFATSGSSEDLLVSLVGGTSGAVIAALASLFLYRSKVAELEKEALVVERNRQLVRTNASLAASKDAMDEILAIASHDLRAPLQSLQSLYELEQETGQWSEDPYRSTLTASLDGCRSMLALVNRLLDSHAQDHQSEPPSLYPAQIGCLVEAAISRNRTTAAQKDIQILFQPPHDPKPWAEINADALDQILDNLLTNAIKYSPHGSDIDVRVTVVDQSVIVQVGDAGPGISQADQANLFKKFKRGSNIPTGGESSTGLGLFIAHKLATSMGAKLSHTNREPHGSVFHLSLPLSPLDTH